VTAFPGYLAFGRVRIARIAALFAVIGGGAYLVWRAPQLTHLGPAAWGFFIAEVFTFLTLASAVPLMWTPRPRRWAPPPSGTLDVFITVCGEDPEMVEATVQAALDIDYPHKTFILNDGRLAGLDGWEHIETLAARLGVPCFTRTTGSRGKAGNLNHGLRNTDGQFVAVIDADHLARPDLGDDLLGHFHPRVAFVATRQDFRIDANDWLGNAEVFFYGVIQPAKDRDNAAFSCGNGVVYRRAALDDIGGFSEWNLVEDLHTSYQLHARGWQSVYVPRPVTTGTAPATAAEMAAQRLRWATDSLRLFFWDNPFLKEGLTFRQKLHYAQTTGVYYLATAFQIAFLLCPALTLLFGIDVLQVGSTGAYLTHLLVFIVPLAAMLVAFAGWRGALRLLQMQSFLAPVFCLAAFRAARMRPNKRARAFSGVTRKSKQQQVNRITLVQHGLFVTLLGSVGWELGHVQSIQWGAILWALVMAGSLCTQNSMISMKWDIAQSARIALTAPVAVAAVLVLMSVWAPFPGASPAQVLAAQTGQALNIATGAASTPLPPPPRRKLVPPRKGVYLGAYDPRTQFVKGQDLSLSQYGDAKMRIIHRYQQWWGDDRWFDRSWAEQVAVAGGVPMITWEPWRKPEGSVVAGTQHPGLLRDIGEGKYDRFLNRWARSAARYRRPMILRFMHEMNGSWYPWQANGNDNTPEDFKRAFRHVHNIFTAHHADNVSWLWSIDTLAGGPPTPLSELETYYPGDHYVDWVGLSGFNWGPESVYPTERSFLSTFQPTVDVVSQLGKPVMLSEVGTSAKSADPAAWLASAMRDVRQLPSVKSLVWFNADTPDADFRLTSDALSTLSVDARERIFRRPLRTELVPSSAQSPAPASAAAG
jgi:cellulose synthase (UDP-forming)